MAARKSKTYKIALAAVMAALTCVVTVAIMIPLPLTRGYIHPGDSIIFLSVLLLGRKMGAVSGALGSAAADLIVYPLYAPFTLAAKFLMAFVFGSIDSGAGGHKLGTHMGMNVLRRILAITVSGLLMVAVYYFAGAVLLGLNTAAFTASAYDIPFNIAQFVFGGAVASALYVPLRKTPIARL
jgi:uncharacterized membrane protein